MPVTVSELRVARQANDAAYRRAMQSSVAGNCWDLLLLTAANDKQAEGYRQELSLRTRSAGSTAPFFPPVQQSLVVPDPPGGRIGSGGATFGVLRALFDHHGLTADQIARRRTLLIHSGGASQRLPMYSPSGKLFAPLPLLAPDGQTATLFDHLYLTLAGLAERLGPGMLILAGDTFLLFDHRRVTPPDTGVTALTMQVPADEGTAHGVFVADGSGRVTRMLQKATVDEMREAGGVDADGRILLDTGMLFFAPDALTTLATLAGVPSGGNSGGVSAGKRASKSAARRARFRPTKGIQKSGVPIDLYEDVTLALAAGTTRPDYLASGDSRIRPLLWNPLRKIEFGVQVVGGEFLHLGTTAQFRQAMVGEHPSPAAELFQQNVQSHSDWPVPESARIFNAVLLADAAETGTLGQGSLVEHSLLSGRCRIGDGAVVSQTLCRAEPFDLPARTQLFQVPVRTAVRATTPLARRQARGKAASIPDTARIATATVVAGVDDNFKAHRADPGCTFCSEPMVQWLESRGLTARDLWPGIPLKKQTLWTARLFPLSSERDGVRSALLLPKRRWTAAQLTRFRKSAKVSMDQILATADPQAMIEHREVIAACLHAQQAIETIRTRQDRPAELLFGRYTTSAAFGQASERLAASAEPPATDPMIAIDQARSLWTAWTLANRPDHPDPHARIDSDAWASEAFARIRLASELGHRTSASAAPAARRLTPGRVIESTAPVRIDLAGGWSDTPPYCYERGGHVVNLAINLEDRPPIAVRLEAIDEPIVQIDSRDLGRSMTLDHFDGRIDPRDPFALHRVALQMVGLLPETSGPVKRWLEPLGGGIRVVTECRVPKGSGLGTSSVLAAALLGALNTMAGHEPTPQRLFEQTLLLEQRLGTGGGWQDQVGGMLAGVKSTITRPGVPQQPAIEPLALSDEQLNRLERRLVVFYTGQQRLARDILRRVVGRWLSREPAMMGLMAGLHDSASRIRQALLDGDDLAVDCEVNRYWQIKRDLFPGSTTPTIDLLLMDLAGSYTAAGLAGAGGGGFAYFLCADAPSADRLRERLTEWSGRPGQSGRVYPASINRTGLQVIDAR